MFTSEQLIEVTYGYIVAMLWSTGDGEEHESYEDFELSEPANDKAYHICTQFVNNNFMDCQLFIEQYQPKQGHNVYECLGHDLWLTSAGHGVGFWDRGLDDLGNRLSTASEEFAIDCYLGDDNLIYLS